MPLVDFSTVECFVDDERIEVYVPFSQKSLGNFLKTRFKAGFKTEGAKKRWVVELQYAKASSEEVVAAIEEHLFEIAGGDWRDIAGKFQAYACASRRYEVKFSAGGIRIMLPGGHPLHYYLGLMCGEKPVMDTWRIPASLIKREELAPMLVRISEEDREVYTDATSPYEGRTITGPLLLPFSRAKEFNLSQGGVVYADYAFVKIADPQVVPMQIHAWPFDVLKLEPGEGHMRATLGYMAPARGARAVGKVMAMARDKRTPFLDKPHAEEKWKSKRV
jgi:hypothetical protein